MGLCLLLTFELSPESPPWVLRLICVLAGPGWAIQATGFAILSAWLSESSTACDLLPTVQYSSVQQGTCKLQYRAMLTRITVV
jgi:hypothetical protein